MTTVLAIESMLESGSSIHETALKAGAARALVEAAFAAVVGQGPKPMICLRCYGHGATADAQCKSCRGSGIHTAAT